MADFSLKAYVQTTATRAPWERIGMRPHHGICLPLFSLATRQSAGIGEFLDLIPLIAWCRSLSIDIIQLLPLNDTGNETSPYSALSANALNPMHISLSALPEWRSVDGLGALYQQLRTLAAAQRVCYTQVIPLKQQFLRTYFQALGQSIVRSQEFAQFKAEHAWLLPYSVFKTLKEKSGWAPWQAWSMEWKSLHWEQLAAAYPQDVDFHCFVQFLCFQQFAEVKRQARRQEVLLKGDIPILISKESADVWENPGLFHLDYSAGAPPDMYNHEGQDWGFPLYDWDGMAKQDFSWWHDRLRTAARCYDLYRLDHIVGFYRIWAIRHQGSKIEKGFIPNDPACWIPQGDRILRELIQGCPMLPIGEDLGTVPREVKVNLKSLGICGTKVMRWERNWEGDKRFIPLDAYEPLSMTTVSTHDSETLPLWWQNHPEEAKEFARFRGWPYERDLSQAFHRQILYDSHHTSSLFHINLLLEYLSLFPELRWPSPEEERINIPGTVSDRNWSYKFRPTLEEIAGHLPLQHLFKNLIHSP